MIVSSKVIQNAMKSKFFNSHPASTYQLGDLCYRIKIQVSVYAVYPVKMSEGTEQQTKRKKNYGPHGYGDPDDYSLRKSEKNLLIPQIRRQIVKEEKCADLIKDYEECVCKAGLFTAPFKCKKLKLNLNDCLEYWNEDEEITARAKKMYLEERREYRRTGVCTQNRQEIFRYLEEKKQKHSAESSNVKQ